MKNVAASLRAGLAAAFTHSRLAGALWFSLLLTAALAWFPAGIATAPFDQSPFRESLVRGWDPWAVQSWLTFKMDEVGLLLVSIGTALLAGLLLQLFLSMGTIRVLLSGVRRPVVRRLLADGAALFRPAAWGALRYALTLAFWEGILVAAPAGLLGKLRGDEAPPHDFLSHVVFWWVLAGGLAVFLNVTLRFDLARIALARGDSSTARGAYRVAKERLRGARPSAVVILLFWLVTLGVVQALFTRLGVAMNPQRGSGFFGLFLVRQGGFFLLAMARVGLWGSLLAWEKERRPVPVLPAELRHAEPAEPTEPPAPEPSSSPEAGGATSEAASTPPQEQSSPLTPGADDVFPVEAGEREEPESGEREPVAPPNEGDSRR